MYARFPSSCSGTWPVHSANGNYWGYLIAIGWPLSHLLVIVIGFTAINRFVFPGSESEIFISTGASPYILCLYPARMIAMVLIQNRSLLNFPLIQPIDIFIARAMLEVLNASVVTIVFCLGLCALDIDPTPVDVPRAPLAVAAAIFFGTALGLFSVVVVAVGKNARLHLLYPGHRGHVFVVWRDHPLRRCLRPRARLYRVQSYISIGRVAPLSLF